MERLVLTAVVGFALGFGTATLRPEPKMTWADCMFDKLRGQPQVLAGLADVICQKLYPLGRVELPKD